MQFSEEIIIKATSNEIFNIYSKVNEWPSWDPDVVESSLFGDFSSGVQGVLKPVNGPKAKIHLTDVVQNKAFTVTSTLPLCKLVFEHELEELEASTRVIHRVTFEGPLSRIFSRIIGPQIRRGLPETLKGLKNISENFSHG
ncbi:MAG: SRPBCC family protein [Gammaproteobacteria bacterium]|nr:SRPBCC family protein [Gammaproteobacteria bacterium]MDH5694847.1 SRPBCC family protein [Gammaproteobacteria bacterium]